MRRFVIIFVLILASLERIFAQDNIDNIILKYLENANVDNPEFIFEKILDLKLNPVDINTSDIYKLEILPFITTNDLKNILNYKKEFGNYISIENLLLVRGFNCEKFNKLRYFIFIRSKNKTKNSHKPLFKDIHNQFLFRTCSNSKPKIKNYEGNNWRYLVKYKLDKQDCFSFGCVMEKDPGEAFFTKHQKKGFDLYSGFLRISLNNFIEEIYIGDYRVSWGQGLILGNSFGSFKSKQSTNVGVGYNRVYGNTSTNENRFFRGVYTKLNLLKNISLRVLYSKRPIDAKIDIKKQGIKSLPNSGYHRTLNEIYSKDVCTEKNIGSSINYNGMYLQIGCNCLLLKYNMKILQSSYYWKKAEFCGRTNMNFSVDYRLNISNFFIYGEHAISKNKCYAHFIGMNFYGSNNLSLSLSARKYDNHYQSKYANGFGELRRTSNEEGIYLGLEYTLFDKCIVNSYIDFFRFKDPNYRMRDGGDGNEELLNISYPFSKLLNIDYKFKREIKSLDKSGVKYSFSSKMKKYSSQVGIDFNLYDNLKFSPKIKYLTFKHLNIHSNGILMYLDIKSVILNSKLKFCYRICYYKTDNYSSRIYEYEHDVLYAFNFKPFYEEGNRMYINMSYKLCKSITFYSKIGYSHKGSNDNLDLNLQIRYKL